MNFLEAYLSQLWTVIWRFLARRLKVLLNFVWHRFLDYFWTAVSLFFALRGPFFLSLFVSAVVVGTDQFEEIIRSVAWLGSSENMLSIFGSWQFFSLAAGSLGCSALLWFWARFTVSSLGLTAPHQKPEVQFFSDQLPRLAGSVPLFALGVACWNAQLDNSVTYDLLMPEKIASLDHKLMTLGTTYLILSALFQLIAAKGYVSRPELPKSAVRHPRLRLFLRLNRPAQAVLLVSLAGWIIYFLGFAIAPEIAWLFVGREALLFAWAGFTAAPLTLACLLAAKTRIPLIAICATFALVIANWNLADNHRIALPPGFQKNASDTRVAVKKDFAAWLEKRPDITRYPTGHYPVFLVAAEGGGIRAAYLTAMTLSIVQDLCPRLRDHIYVISSVSGGSVGAGYFSTLLRGRSADKAVNFDDRCEPALKAGYTIKKHFEEDRNWFAPRASAMAGADTLTPVLGSMLFANSVQLFVPTPLSFLDRGRAQISSFNRVYGHVMGQHRDCTKVADDLCMPVSRLHQVAVDDKVVQLPRLIFNTARVEDGTPAPVTALNLLARWGRDDKAIGLSSSWGLELNMLRPEAISVASAMSMSARFPYITPAATMLPEQLPRSGLNKDIAPDRPSTFRVADGGYYENSGIGLLPEMVMDLAKTEKADSDMHLLILTNSAAVANGHGTKPKNDGQKEKPAPKRKHARNDYNDLASPIRSLLNSRTGHGVVARQRLDGVEQYFVDMNAARRFKVHEIQLGCGNVPIPLGWYLTRAATEELNQQILSSARDCVPQNQSALGTRKLDNREEINAILKLLQWDQPGPRLDGPEVCPKKQEKPSVQQARSTTKASGHRRHGKRIHRHRPVPTGRPPNPCH